MKPLDKLILIYAGSLPEFYASHDVIAKVCGVSESTIKRRLTALKRKNLLAWKRKYNGSNVYQIMDENVQSLPSSIGHNELSIGQIDRSDRSNDDVSIGQNDRLQKNTTNIYKGPSVPEDVEVYEDYYPTYEELSGPERTQEEQEEYDRQLMEAYAGEPAPTVRDETIDSNVIAINTAPKAHEPHNEWGAYLAYLNAMRTTSWYYDCYDCHLESLGKMEDLNPVQSLAAVAVARWTDNGTLPPGFTDSYSIDEAKPLEAFHVMVTFLENERQLWEAVG
jgi:hypothetical protein